MLEDLHPRCPLCVLSTIQLRCSGAEPRASCIGKLSASDLFLVCLLFYFGFDVGFFFCRPYICNPALVIQVLGLQDSVPMPWPRFWWQPALLSMGMIWNMATIKRDPRDQGWSHSFMPFTVLPKSHKLPFYHLLPFRSQSPHLTHTQGKLGSVHLLKRQTPKHLWTYFQITPGESLNTSSRRAD